MASIITHVVIPLSLRLGAGSRKISSKLLFYSCIASMIPDLDVIAFKLGIAYSSEFGHRGFTHSIAFALLIGFFGLIFNKHLSCSKLVGFCMLTFATLSHPLLDAMTDGGLGIAFFWPLTDERYFLPWRPIQVSPIGVSYFIGERGISVLQSEFMWVWLPAFILGGLLLLARIGLSKWRLKKNLKSAESNQ